MFSAKDEGHAVGATLLFNVAHYALGHGLGFWWRSRRWWYFRFGRPAGNIPHVAEDKVGRDLAYPAMLSLLPGLLDSCASLLAAFMSTMSTQLNLGASCLVHDVYGQFIKPDASERERVVACQLSTGSRLLGAGLGLTLTDADEAFNLLLLLRAEQGLVLLRWFGGAFRRPRHGHGHILLVATFHVAHDLGDACLGAMGKLVWGTTITTLGWLISAWVLPSEKPEVLKAFVTQTGVSGPGWGDYAPSTAASGSSVGHGLLQAGCVAVYGALMATGSWLYGEGPRVPC